MPDLSAAFGVVPSVWSDVCSFLFRCTVQVALDDAAPVLHHPPPDYMASWNAWDRPYTGGGYDVVLTSAADLRAHTAGGMSGRRSPQRPFSNQYASPTRRRRAKRKKAAAAAARAKANNRTCCTSCPTLPTLW